MKQRQVLQVGASFNRGTEADWELVEKYTKIHFFNGERANTQTIPRPTRPFLFGMKRA